MRISFSIHLRYCGERPPKPVTEPPQGAEGGVAPRSTSSFALVCFLAVMLQKSFHLSSLSRLLGCIRGCVRRCSLYHDGYRSAHPIRRDQASLEFRQIGFCRGGGR